MPELRQGILKSFDNVNWLATVQLTGSLQTWLFERAGRAQHRRTRR